MAKQRASILRLNYEFARVYRRGKYLSGRYVVVHYIKKKNPEIRVGVSCSRKVKGSVHRNRRKRLLREGFRVLKPQMKPGYDLVLIARNWEEDVKCAAVTADMEKLFRRIGLLSSVTEPITIPEVSPDA